MFGKSKIFVALAFVFTLIFAANTAFAGTSGSTDSTIIFLDTGSEGLFRPYIVLKQDKKRASFTKGTKRAEGSAYAKYRISVEKNGKRVSSPTWHSGSIKIKLDKNARYAITVAYDGQGTYLSNSGHLKMFNGWIEQPYWRLSDYSNSVFILP